jgi:hypothetical protein
VFQMSKSKALIESGPAIGKALSGAVDNVTGWVDEALGGAPKRLSDEPIRDQFDLVRYDPPRGRPDNLKGLTGKRNEQRMMEIAQRGVDNGGHLWYDTTPIKQSFIDELGVVAGEHDFGRFMDYVAATSPRSKVDQNIRRASLFYQREKQGLPNLDLTNKDMPTGYGHLAHETQQHLVNDLDGGKHFEMMNRPKASSFAENLKGNMKPVTVDTHNARSFFNDPKRKTGPAKTQYRYMEEFQQEIADKMGIDPAQFQSAVWTADDTGVANTKAFGELFDEAVARTAAKNDASKADTLKQFIRGDIPLYSLVAGTALSQFMPQEAEASVFTGLGNLARKKAKDQNFDVDTPVYHWTDKDIGDGEFVPSTDGKFGPGIYTSKTPEYGQSYVEGENVRAMPLYTRGNIANRGQILEAENKLISSGSMPDDYKQRMSAIQGQLKEDGFTGLEWAGETVIFDPKNVKSTFAPSVAGAALTGAAVAPEEAEASGIARLGSILAAKGDPVMEIGGASMRGAPNMPDIPGRGVVRIGRNEDAMRAAEDYAERNGLPLEQVYEYVGIDVDRAKRIAGEYGRMKHNPDDPAVKTAYEALARETLDQYDNMLVEGVEPYFIRGNDHPTNSSPYEALIELDQTNRLGVFPTDRGFGTSKEFDTTGNPLMLDSGFKIGGEPAAVNDIFRAVHDYMGHAKQGVGFRAMGEENAWQAHAPMFSPQARRALTTETRGQNSYLNYGPDGQANQTANIHDTVFSDQKTGIMPNWTAEEGRASAHDRRGKFQDDLRAGRTGLEGAVDGEGKVALTHYSRQPLDRIKPDKQLTGMSRSVRSERNRLSGPDAGPERSYYGIEADINPYTKEGGLGAHKHEAYLDGELLYDAATDPENLWVRGGPNANAGEQAIKDQNYSGYYFDHPQLGKVAVVYDELDAKRLSEGGFANPILLGGTAASSGMAAYALGGSKSDLQPVADEAYEAQAPARARQGAADQFVDRMLGETYAAAKKFTTDRADRAPIWEQRKQEILRATGVAITGAKALLGAPTKGLAGINELGTGLASGIGWDASINRAGNAASMSDDEAMSVLGRAVDMPLQGYMGATRAAGELAAGNSIDTAVREGAATAQRPAADTAYDLNGLVVDEFSRHDATRPFAPAVGAIGYGAMLVGSPI